MIKNAMINENGDVECTMSILKLKPVVTDVSRNEKGDIVYTVVLKYFNK